MRKITMIKWIKQLFCKQYNHKLINITFDVTALYECEDVVKDLKDIYEN